MCGAVGQGEQHGKSYLLGTYYVPGTVTTDTAVCPIYWAPTIYQSQNNSNSVLIYSTPTVCQGEHQGWNDSKGTYLLKAYCVLRTVSVEKQ